MHGPTPRLPRGAFVVTAWGTSERWSPWALSRGPSWAGARASGGRTRWRWGRGRAPAARPRGGPRGPWAARWGGRSAPAPCAVQCGWHRPPCLRPALLSLLRAAVAKWGYGQGHGHGHWQRASALPGALGGGGSEQADGLPQAYIRREGGGGGWDPMCTNNGPARFSQF